MQRRIEGFIWREWAVDKLITRHAVTPDEVEEAFFNSPLKVRKASSGKYLLYGRSDGGRYLFVVFAWDETRVKAITARDMTKGERRFLQGR